MAGPGLPVADGGRVARPRRRHCGRWRGLDRAGVGAQDSSVALTVIRRLLRRALEIGHPFSASSAAAWKPAWSRPGTTPRTSRAELVTSTPPPCFGSSDTEIGR